jgi:dTDP-3-amino-3,4,6-trideoxy-alpha-D-glucose transaminase
VHLFGQLADMDRVLALGLPVLEDSAQAHGATRGKHRAGSSGKLAAFSFYPTKNLGALGDGGAVVTSDEAVAARARLLRNYGERKRFEHILHGLNSRLDALQAAILAAKLPHLDEANARRREIAQLYDRALAASELVTPVEGEDRGHVYHLYVVQTDERERFRSRLADAGIGTAVHYPTPIHRQPAYTGLDVEGGFPVAEGLMERIVSLPISADHTEEEILEVAAAAA